MSTTDPIPSITLHEGRTEDAFSRRVQRHFGHRLRYVPEWKKFLVYNGQFWEVDHGQNVDSMIRTESRQLFIEAGAQTDEMDSAEWRDLIKHSKAMNSARGVAAVRALLPSEPGMSIGVNELDRPPAALNVSNGIVDLRNGSLDPHDSNLLLTRLVPYAFDPSAECPTWKRCLSECLVDPELVDHFQKLVGYVLGASVREHKLFIFWGTGANGKSTIIETLLALMGTYGTSAAPDLLMVKGDAHPTEIADLHGHRLVVCSETDEGRRLNEARTKLVTGGDTLTARRMREDFWTFSPTHKLVLLTNHKPQLRGTDVGIRRRLHLVPFTVTIPPERQDRSLGRKLRDELPGILNWAVNGAVRWFREGLGDCAAVRDATRDYVDDQDVIGRFIAEQCIVASWAKVRASSLYAAYRNWCEEQGEQFGTLSRFGCSITERGITKRSSNGIWYDGICLRDTSNTEDLE